jgi:transposase
MGGDKPVIIMYGAATFGNMKGNATAPIKKFSHECEQQHIVIYVDEWMTSQTCPVCFSRFPKTIKYVSDNIDADADDVELVRYVRGLLRCNSEECRCSPYFDRDFVGARNILHVGQTCPKHL